MATASEVKAGLDDISTAIAAVRTRYASAKSSIEGGSAALGNLATKYSDVIATIDGYAPSGAFETLAKDEKEKLAAEYVALKSTIDALINTAEFGA